MKPSHLSPTLGTATSSPLVSSTTPPASEEPSPTDLLLATPPSLLKLFALCRPFISLATTFCQLVTWQHPNFFASLLLLLAWWSVCLFGRWIAQYGFNFAILVFIGSRYFKTATAGGGGGGGGGRAHGGASSSSSTGGPPTLTPAAYHQLLVSSHFLFSHLDAFRTCVVHPLSLQFSFTPLHPHRYPSSSSSKTTTTTTTTKIPAYETARLALTSYPFYLVVTYWIPLRYVFLVVGSVAILWNAPFFTTLRTLCWTSVTIRWAVRVTTSVCLYGGRGFAKEWDRTKKGVGIPGLIGKTRYRTSSSGRRGRQVEERVVKTTTTTTKKATSVKDTTLSSGRGLVVDDDDHDQEEEEEERQDVEVQFTVFENQRWWVGLDWTHALLPGERASWTDPSSNPSNPPSSFVLPSPQITYVPSPTPSDPTSRLKKTTSWRWLDPEWKVLREPLVSVALPHSASPPPPPSSSVAAAAANSPVPNLTTTTSGGESPPSPTTTTSSSIFSSLPSPPTNLLLSSTSSSTSSTSPTLNPTSFSCPSSLISDPHSKLFSNWTVDGEGWQYGDNHFEKMGPKGGLGKYTRRRAWVRRAGLVETTERVSSSSSGSKTPSLAAVTASGQEGKGVRKVGGEARLTSTSRRKSEGTGSRQGAIDASSGSTSTGSKSTSALEQVRKRKSMPPPAASTSKDVD